MSGGEAINRDDAMDVAQRFMSRISDVCERVDIAGSLRRGKREVHDIEIVAEPRFTKQGTLGDLLDDLHDIKPLTAMNQLHHCLDDLLRKGDINTDRPRKDNRKNPFGQKYYRINYIHNKQAYPIDLFAVIPPAQYAVILLIRTGSADFSHWFVQQGYNYGIRVVDGHLERNGVIIDTPDEEAVFRAMHVRYLEPELRERI